MHAFHGKSANFFFNSDMSGQVGIIADPASDQSREILVDAQDILDFVAEHCRGQMIRRIEQMEPAEILDLYHKP